MSKMESDQSVDNQPINGLEKAISAETESFEAFTAAGFKMLVEATKRSNSLPFSKSRDFYESYPSFHNLIENQADYVLSVLSSMMRHANCKGNIKKRDDDDKFEMIVDVNDSLLENVGILLDELSGIKRNPHPEFVEKNLSLINGSWNKNDRAIRKPSTHVLNKILSQTKNLEKPQLNFQDKINNDPNEPFEPRIKYKYNLLKPLALIAEIDEDGVCQFTHPYGFELEKFQPPKEQIIHLPPKSFKPLEETPFFLVTTPEEVHSMLKDLEKCKEIAVDLEHHSYRSFQGFTCLMQISTRETDYVIDTLLLRSDLEVLNKVFTDPSVVKVFHGADSDILWLQRDLGLYVVNMFDTHQAAKLLQFPKRSLSYLLSKYCNIDAQKHFQLADWRVRPLPQELLTYAREDTHYLLYIYDNLRNKLIEEANGQTNMLESVISESTRVCLRRYIKPLYESDGYLDIYHRSKKLFDNRQKFALQQLFEWRDKLARELDESYGYVLPNHMMLNISEVLPREAQGILACCNPIPVPVKQNLLVLHQIILKAREQPLIKPVLEEQRFYRHTTTVHSTESPLQCPHDLNHEGEFRDDLPILFSDATELNSDVNTFSDSESPYSAPIINIFENSTETSKRRAPSSVAEKVIHMTPYHRYKLAKKYSESFDAKNLNKEKDNSEKKQSAFVNPVIKIEAPDDKWDEDDKICEESAQKTCIEWEENTSSGEKKRKIEDDTTRLAKKVKKDKDGLVRNPFHDGSSNPETGMAVKNSQRKKKKKEFLGGRKEKEFQPFDYKSVDFEKYRSSVSLGNKKAQKRQKKRKNGRKNLKISL